MRSTTLALASAALLAATGTALAQTTIYGITRDNRLLSFNAATPGLLASDVAITGLASGETALGIDVRPLTGEIFIFGSSNRMYSVTPGGAATGLPMTFSPLATTVSSFDFNPTVDRVRLIDAAGGNRRLNPTNGADAATDTPLTYASGGTPRAAGVAYTNAQFGANVPAGSVRELFIDSNLNTLGEIGTMAGGNASFNAGVATTIGALGIDVSDDVGFDIFGPSGALYLSNLSTNGAQFYTLNIGSGAALLVGTIGDGTRLVTDIAAIPAPTTAIAAGLGMLVMARRRRV